MTLKSDAKFKEKLIYYVKNEKKLVNIGLSTQNSQNFYFHWFLLCKVYNFWPKKYRGVIFNDNAERRKNWKKGGLWFGKSLEEYGKFSPEYWKVSKFGPWWDPFIQSRKCMSLKITEELCVMTMKNDANFEQKLTCCFKIDMRNMTNFHWSNQKSQKIALFCALSHQGI